MKRVILLGALLALGACADQSALPPVTTLSPEKANDIAAGYSPDGSRIYWWSPAGDKLQLWESPADMSALRKLPMVVYQGLPLLWSPDGSRFAVGAAVDTRLLQLWLMDSAGGEPRRVTTGGAFENPFSWHPDGRRVNYISVIDGDVVTMTVDVDLGIPHRTVPGEARPHLAYWSPDGSQLAVQVVDQGRLTIWLADSDGANLRPLTAEGFEALEGQGATPWSPDGTLLLYTSTRSGAGDIWVAPVDGGQPRWLTNDVRNDNTAYWSTDGNWVAFQSERGQQTDLWVVPAAGGPAERVTDDKLAETLSGWRPGTQELVYTTGRTVSAVWTHTLSDGSERQLTPDSATVSSFNLSPDDQVEVTFNRGGGVFDLTAMPLTGGEPRTVLANAGGSPTRWSPDGSMLAFTSDRGGSNDIWVVDAAGGPPRQLTRWPGFENQPVWSVDGLEIYFNSNHEAVLGDVWRVPVAGGEPARITTHGSILGLCGQNRPSEALFVRVLGQGSATFISARIQPDGSLQTVWDKTVAGCAEVSPMGDSLVVWVTAEGGTLISMLLPLKGGEGRQVLPAGQLASEWSPDGSQLLYQFEDGSATDYGILTLADSSTRRITTTPEDESGAEWSSGGSTLVFRRAVPINRLTTANLTKLLGAK